MSKPYLGIWVDHRDAYLIWADEDGQIQLQHAPVEGPPVDGRSDLTVAGGAGVYGAVPHHARPEDKQRRLSDRLYERIFKVVREAEDVYIFGPGQAKKELKKALQEHKDFPGQIVGIEAADKMSEPQMAAQVRKFFGLPKAAV
jgi:hypothetical protein